MIYNSWLNTLHWGTPMNEIRALETLSKAAELGSLTGAAAEQGITPQAASKSLLQLERQLGVRLMTRSTRRMALTPEGKVLVDASRPALEAMYAALDAVRGGSAQSEGPLTISTSRALVAPVLTPLLEAFSTRHPRVAMKVLSMDRVTAAEVQRCDLALVLDIEANDDVAGVPLMEVQSFHCAAPGFLALYGSPALGKESISGGPDANAGATAQRHRGQAARSRPALLTNDPDLELQAVRSGRMASALLSVLAMPHLSDGSLVPLPSLGVDATCLNLCYSSSKELSQQAKAFIEFAVEKLQGSVEFAPTLARLRALERAGTRPRVSRPVTKERKP